MNIKLRTFDSADALIFQTLETFREIFPNIGTASGIMLAGGRTPLDIYRRAADAGLSTEGTLFLSDERYVPVTNPQSNFKTVSPFFPSLGKIQTELPIEQAAEAFHELLSRLENIPLGLLGLGTDGHTASLFNLQDAALRDERLAIPVIKPEKPDRISVTPTLLNRVGKILILATGAEKSLMIQTLLEKPDTIPAGVALSDHPAVEVWTDQKIG